MRAADVEVKILTGDGELVAQRVCEQVDDVTLTQVAERVAIFARVSPAQKNRIIRALKTRRVGPERGSLL
jgi:Mg2+-importing ATPase